MSVRRNYLASLANEGAQVAAMAVAMVLVARALGPDGKGAVALVLALATMIAGVGFLSLGFGTAYYAAGGRTGLGALGANALVFLAAVGVPVALVLWWLRAPIVSLLHLEHLTAYWPYVVWLVLGAALLELGTGLVEGARRFRALAVANGIVGAVFLAGFVVLFWRGSLSVGVACAAFLAYRLVRAVAAWAVVPWREGGSFRPEWSAFRTAAAYSAQGHGGRMLQVAVYRLDLLLVNGLAGLTSAGLYAAATFFAETLAHGAQALRRVVLPEVAAREAEEARALATRICRQTFWLMVGAALALGVVTPVLVPLLFGEAFRAAVPAVWLLLPGMVALAMTRVLVSAVAGRGWPWAGSAVAAIGLVLMVAFDLLLIPRWGASGAALASSIAYAGEGAFMVWVLCRQLHVGAGEVLAFRRDDFRAVRELLGAVTRG